MHEGKLAGTRPRDPESRTEGRWGHRLGLRRAPSVVVILTLLLAACAGNTAPAHEPTNRSPSPGSWACSLASISNWATAWQASGLAGLQERPRLEKPRRLDATTEQRLTTLLETDPQSRG